MASVWFTPELKFFLERNSVRLLQSGSQTVVVTPLSALPRYALDLIEHLFFEAGDGLKIPIDQ